MRGLKKEKNSHIRYDIRITADLKPLVTAHDASWANMPQIENLPIVAGAYSKDVCAAVNEVRKQIRRDVKQVLRENPGRRFPKERKITNKEVNEAVLNDGLGMGQRASRDTEMYRTTRWLKENMHVNEMELQK